MKYFVTLLTGSMLLLISACAGDVERRQPSGEAPATVLQPIIVKTDSKSIEAGRILFLQKCQYCHHAYKPEKLVGPGLQGIMKKPVLPVSGKPATPENIIAQMKHPYSSMPSFSILPEDDFLNLIAFLNTL